MAEGKAFRSYLSSFKPLLICRNALPLQAPIVRINNLLYNHKMTANGEGNNYGNSGNKPDR